MQKPSLKIAAKALIPSAFISSALLLSSGLMAQGMPDVQKKLDAIIAKAKEKDRFVGLSIFVIDKDKGSFKKHYGFRDHARTLAPDDDTMYEIGSITKVFARLALTAQDKIKPDDLLADHLPEGIRAPKPKGHDITIKQLMTHTGSLRWRNPCTLRAEDPSKMICFGVDLTPGSRNPLALGTKELTYKYVNEYSYSVEELPELFAKPGTFWDYSNAGIGLLGNMLGDAHSQTFEQLLYKSILKPLGMERTAVRLPCGADCENIADVHRLKPDRSGWEPWEPFKTPGMIAAGAYRSSLSDMEKFLRANLAPDSSPIGEVLKKGQSLLPEITASHNAGKMCEEGQNPQEHLCNPIKFVFNGAWQAFPSDQLLFHGGLTPGSEAFAVFSRDRKWGVVVLSNTSNGLPGLKMNYHLSTFLAFCAVALSLGDDENNPNCKLVVDFPEQPQPKYSFHNSLRGL